VARVRAVLRRTTGTPSKDGARGSVLKAADIQIDLLKHEVKKSGKLIYLTKKEYELLECLMRRPGQVLSQTVLTQHLSHTDISTSTNVIEVHIKNLRTKIDNKSGASLIRTVRGCGYALDA
jgi:two-component system copper resistance phosphate regulon response regulator CusR